VVLAGLGPGVVGAQAGGGEAAEFARARGPQPQGAAQAVLDGPVVGVVEDVPVALGRLELTGLSFIPISPPPG
jgi:hypothetical protein